MPQSTRTAIIAFVLGIAAGAVGWATWPKPPHPRETATGTVPVEAAGIWPPLGPSRQSLLDAVAAQFQLNAVNDSPGLFAVELDHSGASVSIGGPAEAPNRANVTGAYNKTTAPTLAKGAGVLAGAIIDDPEWFGSWVADAVKRCDPGFDVVGVRTVRGSGTFEVRVAKAEANGTRVLSVFFRRLRPESSAGQ